MRSVLSLCALLLLLTACSEDNSIPDSDGDGAHDQLDQFPDDVTRAFRIAGDIKNVRGDITLILNGQQVMLSSDQEFLFDIAYGEKFTLLAESNLVDELCIVSSPEHDGTVNIEPIVISCITRTATQLALNAVTNGFLRACIEEQGTSWVDEVVELDCRYVYDFSRLCNGGLELELNSDEITVPSSESDCLIENLDNADGIEEFVFLKKLALEFGYDSFKSRGSKIRFIDLTKNLWLEELNIQAANLDVSGLEKLTVLFISGYEEEAIDLSEFVNLKWLLLNASNLEGINLDALKRLEGVGLIPYKAATIDLTKLYDLKSIFIFNSQIEYLDISNNINLEWIDISSSQLKTLSIFNNNKLTTFNLSGSKIEFLDVSNNINLTDLYLFHNQLKTAPVGIRAIKNKSAEINLESNPFTENAKAELKQLKQEYENLTFDE